MITKVADASGRESAIPSDVSPATVKDLVKVFKLLSDETRLRILLHLAQSGEVHVRALCDRLGQSQPAVSHHLALLRVAGLIECRREGKHNYYHTVTQQIHHLLEGLFDRVPAGSRKIRFDDFVLSYAPHEEAEERLEMAAEA